jgi:hypothetical protein
MVSVFCAAPLCVNDGDDAVLDGVLDRLNVTARALNHKDPWAILREALAIMNDILVSVAAEPSLKQVEPPLAYESNCTLNEACRGSFASTAYHKV